MNNGVTAKLASVSFKIKAATKSSVAGTILNEAQLFHLVQKNFYETDPLWKNKCKTWNTELRNGWEQLFDWIRFHTSVVL